MGVKRNKKERNSQQIFKNMKYLLTHQGEYYKEVGQGMTPKKSEAYRFTRDEVDDIGTLERSDIKILEDGSKKILILGDAQHGKDVLAKMIVSKFDLKNISSSRFALEIFLFDILVSKYGLKYETRAEAYLDRVNHREKWYDEICIYNENDKLRLAKELLKESDIYIGLRRDIEVEEAISQGTFDTIIGIYDHRKPRESKDSNTADMFKYSDIVIMNSGTLEDLANKLNLIKI